MFSDLRSSLNIWITSNNSILNWNPDGVSGLEIEEKICFHFLKNKDRFYKSVRNSISDSIVDVKVKDLINWQQNKIIDLSYNPTIGKVCKSLFDWDQWFNNRDWNSEVSIRLSKYRYIDKQVGFNDWDKQDIIFYRIPETKRPRMFAYQMFTGVSQRKNRLYFKDLENI
jgi:hypothetical protein